MFGNRKGFTLIELMIVVVIIGILAAIAIPNFIAMEHRAREASVKANMHSFQMAVESFAVQSSGTYPVAADAAAVLADMPWGSYPANPFTGTNDRGRGTRIRAPRVSSERIQPPLPAIRSRDSARPGSCRSCSPTADSPPHGKGRIILRIVADSPPPATRRRIFVHHRLTRAGGEGRRSAQPSQHHRDLGDLYVIEG